MYLALLDLTGPARYLPNLVLPLVVAAAIVGLLVYLLRRSSKRSG